MKYDLRVSMRTNDDFTAIGVLYEITEGCLCFSKTSSLTGKTVFTVIPLDTIAEITAE